MWLSGEHKHVYIKKGKILQGQSFYKVNETGVFDRKVLFDENIFDRNEDEMVITVLQTKMFKVGVLNLYLLGNFYKAYWVRY